MDTPPETRYARNGDVRLAYQVVGDGPFDLVFSPPAVSHIEAIWEDPAWAGFFQRLASFSRLILFDTRGAGLSDPVPVAQLPTIEEQTRPGRRAARPATSVGAADRAPSGRGAA